VAILIDEYDAPILSKLDKPDEANVIREALKTFYGVLKEVSEWRGFTFITGVTKFTKASIFSELNNLVDLTLNKKYVDICGLTMAEFDLFFEDQTSSPVSNDPSFMPPILTSLIDNGQLAPEATLADFKQMILDWYDGYTWDGKTRMLNPWSVFSLFFQNEFANYWFNSGTPSFLTKLGQKAFKGYEIFRADNSINNTLNVIDVGYIDPITMLFQAGYLTIDKAQGSIDEEMAYSLRPPNREVLNSYIPLALAQRAGSFKRTSLVQKQAEAVLSALTQRDAAGLELAFASFLAGIPFSNHLPYEAYYQTAFILAMGMAGQRYESQDESADGIFDVHLLTADGTDYIIEFKYVSKKDPNDTKKDLPRDKLKEKMEKASIEAMDQIEMRKYDLKFKGGTNEIYKVAMVVGGYNEVRAVFSLSQNWSLILEPMGGYIVNSQ
jgi:hypothetical protein